jgi:hypothetical protein
MSLAWTGVAVYSLAPGMCVLLSIVCSLLSMYVLYRFWARLSSLFHRIELEFCAKHCDSKTAYFSVSRLAEAKQLGVFCSIDLPTHCTQQEHQGDQYNAHGPEQADNEHSQGFFVRSTDGKQALQHYNTYQVCYDHFHVQLLFVAVYVCIIRPFG